MIIYSPKSHSDLGLEKPFWPSPEMPFIVMALWYAMCRLSLNQERFFLSTRIYCFAFLLLLRLKSQCHSLKNSCPNPNTSVSFHLDYFRFFVDISSDAQLKSCLEKGVEISSCSSFIVSINGYLNTSIQMSDFLLSSSNPSHYVENQRRWIVN